MGEAIQLHVAKARLGLQGTRSRPPEDDANRCPTPSGASQPPLPAEPINAVTVWGAHLLSPPDAAISRTLQEQTRMVLATLMPNEERVLRMRFGIGERADHTRDEIGRILALSRARVLEIESRALRKLRRPSPALRLSSATRI